jgi:hypothetical protein
MRRRHVLIAPAALAAASLLGPADARAHHGWSWTETGEFRLSGRIVQARLGNPHGVLTVRAEGVDWTVEVGQPWRNARAGLEDRLLAPGTDLVVLGHRARDAADRRVKAERVTIAGRTYDLYPDRS